MKRNEAFTTEARQTLVDHPSAHLLHDHVSGPLSWFNPTRARFTLTPNEKASAQLDGDARPTTPRSGDRSNAATVPGAQVEWRARDNRKGRHALIVPHHATKGDGPQVTSEWTAVARGIWRMCTVFAWWDVSWWIGVLFSVGSAIFVACGFFYWLPLAYPETEFSGEASVAGGVTAFIGATLFQIGAILLIVEACVENQTGCFGWALEQAFSHESSSDNRQS